MIKFLIKLFKKPELSILEKIKEYSSIHGRDIHLHLNESQYKKLNQELNRDPVKNADSFFSPIVLFKDDCIIHIEFKKGARDI